MKRLMPQECPIAFVYLTAALYVAGLAYLALSGELAGTVAWLVVFPLAILGYIRIFPRVSAWLGYGRVDDEAPSSASRSSRVVTVYRAAVCPFCPLVEERLRALQEEMGFELEHVDLTLRPDLVRAKKIRSVPVVEVGGRRHVGNATSRELADLIAGGSD